MPKIIELARKNLITAEKSANFSIISNIMLKNNVGSVVITEENRILGFVDDKTILQIISKGKDPRFIDLHRYINQFETLDQNLEINDAWEVVKKSKNNERFGVIDENGNIKGIIRKRTINDFRVRLLREELNIMENIY